MATWMASIARSTRSAASSGSSVISSGTSSSDRLTPYRFWMIPSWRSLRDALALVDDGQAMELLVQPRVLHGDAGVEREGLDERLVFRAELGGADLSVR